MAIRIEPVCAKRLWQGVRTHRYSRGFHTVLGARQIRVLPFGTSWEFLFLNIFDQQLVEPADAKLADVEGGPYPPYANQN